MRRLIPTSLKGALMKKQEAVTFNLPAHLDYLPIAASAARHCAILRGFSTEEAGRISLALVEAATNAIELGFNADTDRLRIGLAPTALGLKLRVRSRGIPLETMELPQYDPDKAEDQLDITGLGLLL
ncbi:MAG: ATP-binding protein, partial [Proteobacteria bacterium]|nr:ATP-binding protein [Pseudomonadota bacterium]